MNQVATDSGARRAPARSPSSRRSPSFHRRHHAIALGHEPGSQPLSPYGANYGVLLPWWDLLFRSADWRPGLDATGIDDQVLQGRDYGRGFWAQQWLGLKRLMGGH